MDETRGVSQALMNFRASKRLGAWLYLEKDQLVQEVESTVENPFLVYQERATLSGVAAVVFELARRQPLRYVAICRELYESGAFINKGRLIEPSSQLRKSYPLKGMRTVDWLLLATMREAEATLFPGFSMELPVMISHPSTLRGWIQELLGLEQTSFISTEIFGALEGLQQAINVLRRKGIVFLLVDISVLGMAKSRPFRHPSHWLTLSNAPQLSLTVESITLSCHSWGQRYQLELDRATFEAMVFGMVFGEKDIE